VCGWRAVSGSPFATLEIHGNGTGTQSQLGEMFKSR
jgi:hypothetical protein